MDWLPAAVAGGGPWAILGGVVLTVFGLMVRGALLSAWQVDRLIEGYKERLQDKKDDVTAWKTAHALEVEANRVLRAQVTALLEHSGMSVQAWQSIKAAAESRTDDVPT